MLFNSLTFIIFFLVVYSLYLLIDHKKQNRMLLIASYIFYGWWSWKFLFLMAFSTVVDYYAGLKIYYSPTDQLKRRWKLVSIVVNLSLLGVFKYFNFFVEELTNLVNVMGGSAEPLHLNIVLPVGISFYTFQTISYSWDIYRKEVKPIKNFWDFALFVSFFPQLVAGPIERAKNLIPQIVKPRTLSWDNIYEGSYLIMWGFFKKVYIADTAAPHVNKIFALSVGEYTSLDVMTGVLLFAIQIYGDFSGYSDIARGLSKLMGFDLMVNFNLPYFAQSPSDFWRRWHISLSSWLRDYLYIPLGGNKKGIKRTYINLYITMILGGLWHGASMHFVIWGAYQGLLLGTHKLWRSYMSKYDWFMHVSESLLYKVSATAITFTLTCYGWLIFRVESATQLFEMSRTLINFNTANSIISLSLIIKISWILVIVQSIQFFTKDLMRIYKSRLWLFRGVLYFMLLYFTMEGATNDIKEFIYFQF